MRLIEQLLGKRAEDEKSDLDEVQVQRLCHLLRGQGGDHGGKLADALVQDVGPTSQPSSEPSSGTPSSGTRVD